MLACQTQWRMGFSGATGLDYAVLYAVAGSFNITVTPAILRGVMTLERYMLQRFQKESTG